MKEYSFVIWWIKIHAFENWALNNVIVFIVHSINFGFNIIIKYTSPFLLNSSSSKPVWDKHTENNCCITNVQFIDFIHTEAKPILRCSRSTHQTLSAEHGLWVVDVTGRIPDAQTFSKGGVPHGVQLMRSSCPMYLGTSWTYALSLVAS